MAQVDATSFDAALKEYFSDEHVVDTVYEDNPWFAMIPKKQITGKTYVQPVQYGIPQSRSADIAVALGNKKTNKYVDFQVPTFDDYSSISIGRKVMKQSANDRGAFFEARAREIEGMLKSLTRSAAISLYRNGGGSIGQVAASGISTTSLTLKNIEDVVNFEVGQEIVMSANDGSDSSHTLRTGSATITAVNRDTGVLTTDANWTAQISGATDDDHLFVEGDFQNKMQGFLAWVPTTAPTSTAFNGVDRSVDPTRLGGCRIDGTSLPIVEAIREGCSRVGREGGMPDCAFMSFNRYNEMLTELENKVEYTTTGVTANVSFTGVKIYGGRRPVVAYADHNCPDDRICLVRKDTWKLISLGPVPDLHDEDGVRMLRESGSDGFEVRASYYANSVCEDPRSNAVINLV